MAGRCPYNLFISFRLRIAETQNHTIFFSTVIKAIYKHSPGIPRLINTLRDAVSAYGYADDVKVISRDLIEAVAKAVTWE